MSPYVRRPFVSQQGEFMPKLALLLDDERGTAFVKYSSIALLIAIAALAVLGQADGRFIN